ncbi:MAG: hypothetical protein LBJ86_02960 [Spirochaetaceae bacterium]|nr:hypothetical protein [Spirochaetaceae bacterium]
MNLQTVHRKLTSIFAALLVFFAALNVYGQDLPDRIRAVDYPFARNRAIGGGHTALDGDFSSIFTNPAAMVGVMPQKSIAKLSVDVNYIDLVFRILQTTEPMPEIDNIFVKHFDAGVDVGGPIALGMTGKNFGLGLFNVTRLGMLWNRNEIYKLSPTLTEEIALAGAFGLRLYNGSRAKFDIGLTGKMFVRAGYRDTPLYLHEIRYILQDLFERTFETQIGGGVDIGLRWTLYDSLSFAAVFYDPYSPAWVVQYSKMDKVADREMTGSTMALVAPRATAGVSWKINSRFLSRFFSRITLSCDYTGLLDNPFNPSRDPLLNIGAGLEICMHEVFFIRAGLRDMMPSAGIGLDFTFMSIDVSAYGSELGTSPGQLPVWAGAIDISFKK